MANKQTLPTLNEPKSGFINSNAMGNVTAVKDWKEKKWASVANLSNGIVGVSTAYKNMKHTEMLAKLDNLQQQNLHNLGDAKDPCELPDLINNANKSYDDLFKDDPYGKSFYESEAYNKFKIKNEQLTQNKVNELNHKFSSIQAVATGNEISSDIALMGDPERMSNALKSYEAMLSQMELTADEKFRIMGAVTKDSFGKVFTNNPNNAVNWYNYSNGAYDKYGVDGADLIEKAKQKNIQDYRLFKAFEKEKKEEEERAKKQAKEEALNESYSTALKYKLGDISSDEVYKTAKSLNEKGFASEAYTLITKAFPESATQTQKQITIQNIGNRINNLDNLSYFSQPIERIKLKRDIEEAKNLGFISKELSKQWDEQLTPKTPEETLEDVKIKAETGSLNDDDLNYLDDLVADEKIKTTQRDAIIDKNTRNQNIAQYSNQIHKEEITSNSQIDNLNITDEQKVSLKEQLKKYKTSMGYETEEIEQAYRDINNGNYKDLLKSIQKVPASKRQPILDKWKEKVKQAQIENYEKLQTKLSQGELTTEYLDLVYANRHINYEQYKNIKAEIIDKSVKEVRANAAEIASKIIKGEIKTRGQLDEAYNDVNTNTPYYLTNYNALNALLNEKSKPYWEILNKAYSTIDSFLKRDVFGNNTTASVKNAAEAKRQLLYIFTEQLQKDNITIEKMQEILSPNNVTTLAQVYTVDYNDNSQSYQNVGAQYNREEFINVYGNINIDDIKQLDSSDFIQQEIGDIKQFDSSESIQQEDVGNGVNEENDKTVLEILSDWINGSEPTPQKKESEKISDVEQAMKDLENIELDDEGLLKEGL